MSNDYEFKNDPRRNKMKKRLAPGFWVDQNDCLHVSVEELLKHHDLLDTPTNRERMTALANDTLKELSPTAEIVHRQTPND